jgi:hypothetical protein
MLLSQKASEAEQEITRIRLSNMKTEEEKVHLEQKTRDAVRLTEMLVQESEKRALEEKKLKDELLRARIAEKEAKEKLLEFLSRNAYTSTITVNIKFFKIIFIFYCNNVIYFYKNLFLACTKSFSIDPSSSFRFTS